MSAYRCYAVCADPSGRLWTAESLVAGVDVADVRMGPYGYDRQPVPNCPALGYLQIASGLGTILVAGTTRDDGQRLIVVDPTGLRVDLGPTYGTNQVQIRFDDLAGVFVVMAVISKTQWAQWLLTAGLSIAAHRAYPLPPSIVGTSQGLLGIFEGGEPAFTDLCRVRTLPEVGTLTLPTYSSWYEQGQVIGQWGDGGIATAGPFTPAPGLVTSFPSQLPPQVAVGSGGHVIAGVAGVGVIANPYPALPVAPPTPTPNPTPNPVPEPNPNPEAPVPDAALAPWANRLDIVQAVDRDYPDLLGEARRLGNERLRGFFVDQVAHRLNRIDQTDRWGRKARREGDPNSLNDDALTYRLTENPADKKLIDIVQGDDYRPGWDLRPASEEPGNGFWHPPLMRDLDTDPGTPAEPPPPADPPSTPPSPPPPPPSGDPHEADAIVTELFGRLEQLRQGQVVLTQSITRLVGEMQRLVTAQVETNTRLEAVMGQADVGMIPAPEYRGTVRLLGMTGQVTLTPVQTPR